MSNLLNESIVDAKALRESALKNAESVVIEKYAEEVKKTLENLLEQDDGVDFNAAPLEEPATEPAADTVQDQSDEVPLAATDGLAENEGSNLDSLPAEGEEVEVTLDLGALQEAIEALSVELDEEVELELDEEEEEEEKEHPLDVAPPHTGKPDAKDFAKLRKDKGLKEDEEIEVGASMGVSSADAEEADAEGEAADAKAMTAAGLEEEIDMDGLFDSVMEKLTADMGAGVPTGWAGAPASQLKYQQDRQLAKEASTESEEESALEEEQEELNESKRKLGKVISKNETLQEELVNYQSAMENLKENLYEVNLSNARLLYTNRVLRNTSLNERQKDKIVEAISGAGSVTEAKTIFETLQSTVEAKPTRSPQSLSEAISSRTSVLTASRKETKVTSQDPFSDRMRRLAGIK